VLIHPQPEYGERDVHAEANDAIWRLVRSRDLAAVPIDTRLDVNSTGLLSPTQVESLVARMDVVLTTRLHGTVLAIKNGVPAIAIDPVAGGAKILRQAQTIGWPIVFTVDQITDERLQEALDFCLSESARVRARNCAESTVRPLEEVKQMFLAATTPDMHPRT
jgi:polysaccharide pyruvyl transferase WcaK-like protein